LSYPARNVGRLILHDLVKELFDSYDLEWRDVRVIFENK